MQVFPGGDRVAILQAHFDDEEHQLNIAHVEAVGLRVVLQSQGIFLARLENVPEVQIALRVVFVEAERLFIVLGCHLKLMPLEEALPELGIVFRIKREKIDEFLVDELRFLVLTSLEVEPREQFVALAVIFVQ